MHALCPWWNGRCLCIFWSCWIRIRKVIRPSLISGRVATRLVMPRRRSSILHRNRVMQQSEKGTGKPQKWPNSPCEQQCLGFGLEFKSCKTAKKHKCSKSKYQGGDCRWVWLLPTTKLNKLAAPINLPLHLLPWHQPDQTQSGHCHHTLLETWWSPLFNLTSCTPQLGPQQNMCQSGNLEVVGAHEQILGRKQQQS